MHEDEAAARQQLPPAAQRLGHVPLQGGLVVAAQARAGGASVLAAGVLGRLLAALARPAPPRGRGGLLSWRVDDLSAASRAASWAVR
jgi:hypothetical protein